MKTDNPLLPVRIIANQFKLSKANNIKPVKKVIFSKKTIMTRNAPRLR